MDTSPASAEGSGFRRGLANLAGGFRQWFADQRARRRLRAEIEALDRAGALDGVLGDIEMTRSDVDAIVEGDPRSGRRLQEMLARLGLAGALRRAGGKWSRDVELTCLRCAQTKQCDHWLKSGRQDGMEEFCPNANTFKTLPGR
jgi:hypothetical protein